ncbi:hypothetical protein AAFC00_006596 [Neodothiora populina]|uniref:Zn(2)-C6 fungal-type domain-containing protein n=1 Tax=Neodothiora populina TaxID=2781224 RepID=A0ABR3PAU2_9PEZI
MPKITRSRESHSCRTCRRRRVKCDKIHPACSRCAASSLTCIYSDRNAPTPGSPKESPSSSSAVVERAPARRPIEHGHLEVGQNGFSFHASPTFWGNSSKQLGGTFELFY